MPQRKVTPKQLGKNIIVKAICLIYFHPKWVIEANGSMKRVLDNAQKYLTTS